MELLLRKNHKLLLKLFLASPERKYYLQEIARALGKKPGVFHRAINALEKEGILTSFRQANARFFKVNRGYPCLDEVCGIIFKSLGPEETLRAFFKKSFDVRCAYMVVREGDGLGTPLSVIIVGRPNGQNTRER